MSLNKNNTTSETQDTELAKSITVAEKNDLQTLTHKNKIVDATKAKTRSILEKEVEIAPTPLKIENEKEGVLEQLEQLFHLKESYETQVSRYRSLGRLVQKDGKEGIVAVDEHFYPIPSLDDVQEVLSEQVEFLTQKHSQGFNKFILAPFGMSSMEMYEHPVKEYKMYMEDPALGLYPADSIGMQPSILDNPNHYFARDNSRDNQEAEIVYYPETQYRDDSNVHKAKSKTDLISNSRFPGWELHLVPENPILPRGRREE